MPQLYKMVLFASAGIIASYVSHIEIDVLNVI